MFMKKKETIDFSSVLNDQRVPIVILDERWHRLFEKQSKSAKVSDLEKKLGDLLKQQGRLVTDLKELKSAKHQLMDGIVANMNVDSTPTGKLNEKKLQKSQKLILDINSKLKTSNNDLADMPYRIRETNAQLVVEGMNQCYQKMDSNSEELQAIKSRIESMREELKQLVAKQKDLEQENAAIYTYMHDVLGSQVMEMLDHHYHKKR